MAVLHANILFLAGATHHQSKQNVIISAENKYAFSEPEHEAYTKNSLVNDVCSANGAKKALESKWDFACDIFIDEYSPKAHPIQRATLANESKFWSKFQLNSSLMS